MTPLAVAASPRRRNNAGLFLYVIGGTLASILFLLPLIWGVLRSFMPSTMVIAAPSASDFSHLTTKNYSGLISANDISHYVGNSLMVACGTALLTAVVATTARVHGTRSGARPSALAPRRVSDAASAT